MLEEALKTLQASISSEPHPLLRDKESKTFPDSSTSGHLVDEEEVLDALGTFSLLGDGDEVSLYGPTATTEARGYAPLKYFYILTSCSSILSVKILVFCPI